MRFRKLKLALVVVSVSLTISVTLWLRSLVQDSPNFDSFSYSRSSSPIYSLAFSTDGKKLAAGTHQAVEVWDACRPAMLHRLEDRSLYVRAVAFSRDDKTFCSGGSGIRIWSTTTWTVVEELDADAISCMSLSLDGVALLCGRYELPIQIWDLCSTKLTRTVPTSPSWIVSLSYSPEKGVFALGGVDGTVEVWNLDKAQRTSVLQQATTQPAYVAFSPTHSLLAYSGAADNSIKLFDMTTQKL